MKYIFIKVLDITSETDVLQEAFIKGKKDLYINMEAIMSELSKTYSPKEIEEYIIAQPDTVKYLGESKIKKMIIPIYGYGEPVLRQVGEEISPEYPNLKDLIANMYDTMYNAYGVGLAAPQIGLAIRLFVIDTEPFSDSEDLTKEELLNLIQ